MTSLYVHMMSSVFARTHMLHVMHPVLYSNQLLYLSIIVIVIDYFEK